MFLAFHRLGEGVEFGADRAVDHLAAELDDDSAEDVGIDLRIDRDVAADAGRRLRLERGELVVVERMGRRQLPRSSRRDGRRRGGEGADDRPELALAAVPGEDAEEIGR